VCVCACDVFVMFVCMSVCVSVSVCACVCERAIVCECVCKKGESWACLCGRRWELRRPLASICQQPPPRAKAPHTSRKLITLNVMGAEERRRAAGARQQRSNASTQHTNTVVCHPKQRRPATHLKGHSVLDVVGAEQHGRATGARQHAEDGLLRQQGAGRAVRAMSSALVCSSALGSSGGERRPHHASLNLQ